MNLHTAEEEGVPWKAWFTVKTVPHFFSLFAVYCWGLNTDLRVWQHKSIGKSVIDYRGIGLHYGQSKGHRQVWVTLQFSRRLQDLPYPEKKVTRHLGFKVTQWIRSNPGKSQGRGSSIIISLMLTKKMLRAQTETFKVVFSYRKSWKKRPATSLL